MKVIAVYGNLKETDRTGNKTLVWPDSVIVNSGKPVFLPEMSRRMILGVGVKIDAVGKSIKTKFADRYYKDMFPVAFILRENVADSLMKDEDPYACDIVEDYSIIHGKVIHTAGSNGSLILEVSLSSLKNGDCRKNAIKINNFNEAADTAIETTSVYNTLKTGDIVAFLIPFCEILEPDTLLTVKTGDGDLLIENKLK